MVTCDGIARKFWRADDASLERAAPDAPVARLSLGAEAETVREELRERGANTRLSQFPPRFSLVLSLRLLLRPVLVEDVAAPNECPPPPEKWFPPLTCPLTPEWAPLPPPPRCAKAYCGTKKISAAMAKPGTRTFVRRVRSRREGRADAWGVRSRDCSAIGLPSFRSQTSQRRSIRPCREDEARSY